ncbi:MAG: hypothetical protein ABI954_03530 [Pyrinomonadaceae bacterium]
MSAIIVLSVFIIGWAQDSQPINSSTNLSTAQATQTIEDVYDGDVFGFNKTVVIKGSVTKGVLAFGGDIIVEGRVEGDVATIGGSVYQRPNSFIGGDVIILGGGYNHGKTAPGRNPDSQTVMYAGYENELRQAMQNPSSLFAPSFSAAFLVQRIIAVLFWFIVSLVLTTVSPGAVSRAISRLHLTSLPIAIIGCLAMIVITLGNIGSLKFLPAPLGIIIWLMLTVLMLLAYIFGYVCIQAATGKYLQKLFFGEGKRSESTALLLGACFWTAVLSIPFVWAATLVGLLVVSLGLVLTARPTIGWKLER